MNIILYINGRGKSGYKVNQFTHKASFLEKEIHPVKSSDQVKQRTVTRGAPSIGTVNQGFSTIESI